MIDAHSLALVLAVVMIGLVGWYALSSKNIGEFAEQRRNKKKRVQNEKQAAEPKKKSGTAPSRSHVAPTSSPGNTVSNNSNNTFTDAIILSQVMHDHQDHKSSPVCTPSSAESSSSSSNTDYWSSDSDSRYSSTDSGSSYTSSDSGSSSFCD